MFVVKKGEEKKNRFVTHYEAPRVIQIKLENFKKPKIQPTPKIKDKEKEPIKIVEKKNNIIIQPQIPKNLFCILHNQNQVPITPPKFPSPHLKKKRFIDDDTGNTIGRWSRDEHKKFIEAIIKFGNNWKEVQEYVNSRTSTQARSHAQKFFEKIKKNDTLKFFDSLDSDYSENFTNATILQLHNLYGNKSKGEINAIVNKFLSLEYDLPKKRRKLLNNNIGGIPRKKNNFNNRKNIDINEDDNYEEKEENEDYNNNENIRNNNYYDENIKNDNNDIIADDNLNNGHDYYENKILHKPKMIEDMKKGYYNKYYDNYHQSNYNGYNYNADGIEYIISQFVNNLSDNCYEVNPNDSRGKMNKRKNTFESLGEESLIEQENLNYFNQNSNYGQASNQNFNNSTQKSRKNSIESMNKFIQNEKNDFNDIYKRMFGIDEFNQNKLNLDMNDLKNQNILEDDITLNLLKN